MVQRIVGLASGMDIDTMVKQLMTAAKVPLDKLKQKQQVLEWQRDDYRTLNTAFFDFRTTLTNMKLTPQYRVRSTVSSNENMVTATASSGAGLSSYTLSNINQLASTATMFNKNSISNSTSSKIDPDKDLMSQMSNLKNGATFKWKDGVVETQSLSVGTDAKNFSLGLNGVSLATDTTTKLVDTSTINVKVNGISYQVVTKEADLGTNKVFVDNTGNLKFNTNISAGSSIKVDYVTNSKIEEATVAKDATEWQLSRSSISNIASVTINDVDYQLGTPDPTTGEINIMDPGTTSVFGTINPSTGKITFANSLTKDTKVKVQYIQKYSNFNIQSSTSKGQMNENFLIQGSDTLNGVMNKVNGSTVGINMFYDSFSDKITMTRTETGKFNNPPESPDYTGIPSQEFQTTGDLLNSIFNFNDPTKTTYIDAENADFEVNGLSTYRNSNTFEMNGVTFTLKQVTNSTNPTPVTVSVKNDSDKVFDNIKAFVDQYNKLIDQVQGKLSEERDRDYTPLTDDQRVNLSDTQQQQWEAKAKSGLLRGDTTLSSALTQMRASFYQSVQNPNVAPVYNQLASVGITTSPDYTQGGKLEIDEAALKKAIETDPTSVENLFRGTGDTVESKGIAQRLYDNVTNTINSLNDKAGKTYSTNNQFVIGRSLDDLTNQINSFNDHLTKLEDRYYSQFTAMEQAIQQSNQQSTSLMQYFGGSSGN